MLKYLPSKLREKNATSARALPERLGSATSASEPGQQLRLNGHTGYCHAFLVDVLLGEILAEYASNSALPFRWRNPLPTSPQIQPVDVGPALSVQQTIELLKCMMSSTDSQTVDQWNSLKVQLDQDRMSGRNLFND